MLHHNKTAKSKPKIEQTINESLTPNKTTEQSRTKGEPGYDSQNKTLCFQWLTKKFILGVARVLNIGFKLFQAKRNTNQKGSTKCSTMKCEKN